MTISKALELQYLISLPQFVNSCFDGHEEHFNILRFHNTYRGINQQLGKMMSLSLTICQNYKKKF